MTKAIPQTAYILMAMKDGLPYIVQHRTFWKTPVDAENWWNWKPNRLGRDRPHFTIRVELPADAAPIKWKVGRESGAHYFIGA